MCNIMYKPMGVGALKQEYLRNAFDNNPDGWGILIRSKNGDIQVEKGFDNAGFENLGSKFGEDYDVVAHTRIATSGKKDFANLHPFAIYASPPLSLGDNTQQNETPANWLFHNGIVQVKEWNKNMSDTWHLARLWEKLYGHQLTTKLRIKTWRRRQKMILGTYNKFVVANQNGITIINPNAGLWHEGVWHSNRTAIDEPTYGYFGRLSDLENKDELLSEDGIWVKQANGSWKHEGISDMGLNEGLNEALDADPSAGNCGGEEFLETPTRKFNLIYNQIDEWLRLPNISDIEETIYNYDGITTAKSILYLLKRANLV